MKNENEILKFEEENINEETESLFFFFFNKRKDIEHLEMKHSRITFPRVRDYYYLFNKLSLILKFFQMKKKMIPN